MTLPDLSIGQKGHAGLHKEIRARLLDVREFASLQAAIDAAPAVLHIPAGTYTGNFAISAPMKLTGDGAGTIITGSIDIKADDVQVCDLTINGATAQNKPIYIGAVSNCTIQRVRVDGSPNEAIYHDGIGKNIRVMDCEIFNHGLSAIDCNSAATVGFYATGNYIHDGGSGIHVVGQDVYVVDNVLEDLSGFVGIISNKERFITQYVRNLVISRNHISNFGASSTGPRYGIAIGLTELDENIIVSENTIYRMHETAGQPCRAINAENGRGLIVSNNIISDCIGDAAEGVGISVSQGILHHNIIRGTGWQYGIICSDSVVESCFVEDGAVREGGCSLRDDAGLSSLIRNRFYGQFIHNATTYNTDKTLDGVFVSKFSEQVL
jgi:hypothetical protein